MTAHFKFGQALKNISLCTFVSFLQKKILGPNNLNHVLAAATMAAKKYAMHQLHKMGIAYSITGMKIIINRHGTINAIRCYYARMAAHRSDSELDARLDLIDYADMFKRSDIVAFLNSWDSRREY
jgi:hypothetical protein